MDFIKRIQKPLAYIGMPAAFCAVGYLLFFLALQPVWGLIQASAGMFVSKNAHNFDSTLISTYDKQTSEQATATFQESGADFISGADIDFPLSGENYAHLYCPEIGLDAPMYWFDSDEILLYGVGQSLISLPPGFGFPIVLSGHNTTHFRCLQHAMPGNVIHIDTNYGSYQYTVTHIEVYDENELGDFITQRCLLEPEELIMYTCYPFEVVTGRKTERLTVFADLTSGIPVKWRADQ